MHIDTELIGVIKIFTSSNDEKCHYFQEIDNLFYFCVAFVLEGHFTGPRLQLVMMYLPARSWLVTDNSICGGFTQLT